MKRLIIYVADNKIHLADALNEVIPTAYRKPTYLRFDNGAVVKVECIDNEWTIESVERCWFEYQDGRHGHSWTAILYAEDWHLSSYTQTEIPSVEPAEISVLR